jgi:SpoVK/Ycf46/Vps4 family AAA+-type ATPase
MGITDMARKIPGVAAVEGVITGVLASEQDLPIKDYDKQTAADITAKLKGLSQRELRMVGAYERKHENRATIIDKIAKLTGEEPWSGYDEQSVEAVTTALYETTTDTAREVKAYERDHKGRSGVIEAADKRIERN